ncbi:MAG: class I SAM-dependent methyltransferase [Candidatus Krumholzibacteriia bacterium]
MDRADLESFLRRLAAAEHPPRAGDVRQPPWSDPAFSERMLAVHLDDTTHMASRAGWVIERHVDWLEQQLARHRRRRDPRGPAGTDPAGGRDQGAAGRPWRILDVTCGPGLYAHELARRGWPTVGVDFAPAALRHARQEAAAAGLPCLFLQEDVTRLPADLPQRVGPLAAVTFWFGEFHALAPESLPPLLERLAACLEPGGLLVLEYQPWDSFPRDDERSWEVCDRSPFHDGLQLWLQEWAWDDAASAMVDVHWIAAADGSPPQRYVQAHRAYRDGELDALLRSAGLGGIARHPPVTGCDPAFEFPLLVAVRS